MGVRSRSRRRQRSLPDVKVTGKGTPVYEVLSKPDLEKLVDATFQLRKQLGAILDKFEAA